MVTEEELDPRLVAALAEALQPVPMSSRQRSALRGRVLDRAGGRSCKPIVRKAADEVWLPLLPRVSIRPLRVEPTGKTQTSVWKLEAGAVLPEHPHCGEEECLVLDGSVLWDGLEYGKGDYLLAPAGSHHTEIATRTGALLLIRSDLSEPLAALFARAGF
jgi:anti-sigma factor ChrR (cupin superfamily)